MQILVRARHLCTRIASFPGVRPSLARALRDEFAIFEPNELQAKALPIAPALEKLYLGGNKIGDEGVRHLSDALTRGAAPALTQLSLYGNPASAAAQQAVKDALKQRASRE